MSIATLACPLFEPAIIGLRTGESYTLHGPEVPEGLIVAAPLPFTVRVEAVTNYDRPWWLRLVSKPEVVLVLTFHDGKENRMRMQARESVTVYGDADNNPALPLPITFAVEAVT